jgi:hypothetical protein
MNRRAGAHLITNRKNVEFLNEKKLDGLRM